MPSSVAELALQPTRLTMLDLLTHPQLGGGIAKYLPLNTFCPITEQHRAQSNVLALVRNSSFSSDGEKGSHTRGSSVPRWVPAGSGNAGMSPVDPSVSTYPEQSPGGISEEMVEDGCEVLPIDQQTPSEHDLCWVTTLLGLRLVHRRLFTTVAHVIMEALGEAILKDASSVFALLADGRSTALVKSIGWVIDQGIATGAHPSLDSLPAEEYFMPFLLLTVTAHDVALRFDFATYVFRSLLQSTEGGAPVVVLWPRPCPIYRLLRHWLDVYHPYRGDSTEEQPCASVGHSLHEEHIEVTEVYAPAGEPTSQSRSRGVSPVSPTPTFPSPTACLQNSFPSTADANIVSEAARILSMQYHMLVDQVSHQRSLRCSFAMQRSRSDCIIDHGNPTPPPSVEGGCTTLQYADLVLSAAQFEALIAEPCVEDSTEREGSFVETQEPVAAVPVQAVLGQQPEGAEPSDSEAFPVSPNLKGHISPFVMVLKGAADVLKYRSIVEHCLQQTKGKLQVMVYNDDVAKITTNLPASTSYLTLFGATGIHQSTPVYSLVPRKAGDDLNLDFAAGTSELKMLCLAGIPLLRTVCLRFIAVSAVVLLDLPCFDDLFWSMEAMKVVRSVHTKLVKHDVTLEAEPLSNVAATAQQELERQFSNAPLTGWRTLRAPWHTS